MNFHDLFRTRLEALSARVSQEFPPEILPKSYRSAAVLLPFWAGEGGSVKVAFTRRAETLSSHKGQVSFPGGSVQESDASAAHTALRETTEELGIDPLDICIKGRLDDAWSAYGFHIVPYVGWMEQKPVFKPDPAEVAAVMIADVEMLMRPENSGIHRIETAGGTRTTHAFIWDDGYVWGITADILLELFLWVRGENSNRRDIRLEYLKKQLEQGAGELNYRLINPAALK